MAKIEIEVKRVRSSETQGYADVYVNGKKMISFGDEIELIREGELYYGELIGCWGSKTPDADFIKDAIMRLPLYEQLSRPFLEELDKTKLADVKRRSNRKTIEMIKEALQENLPFDEKQVDAGATEILNTEINGHRIDLGASLEWLSDQSDPDFEDGTHYIFNLFVDGAYVNIPGAWSMEEIQKEPEFLVNYLTGAWEDAALRLEGTSKERPMEPAEKVPEELSAAQEQSDESFECHKPAVRPHR